MGNDALIIAPIAGLLGLAFSLYLAYTTLKNSPGTAEMADISRAIQTGASTFLKREYRVIGSVALLFAPILALVLDPYVMVTFLVGVLCSALSGVIGMTIATRTNTRTTYAARDGLHRALNVAFSGGAVMGMAVLSLGTLGISGTYLFFAKIGGTPPPLSVITGYSIGASFIAIFIRIGGGIFTKAADMGADLVGKVEIGIPEDDPRNAAVIADQVGDNVGDVAGMGADLNQSFTDTLISSLLLGAGAHGIGGDVLGAKSMVFPLLVVTNGILASTLGILIVKLLSSRTRIKADKILRAGMLSSGVISSAGVFLIAKFYMGDTGVFFAVVSGLVTGILVGLNTEYYTYRKPVRLIVESTDTGPATTIISGLAVGLESTVLSMTVLALGLIIAHHFAGLYGIALAGIGMLSILGLNISTDAFGPIADNAGGIAQMSGQDPQIREVTDKLDAVGNTTAAMGKAFASSATAAAALSLLTAYSEAAQVGVLDIRDVRVMGGLLIGGVLPALFSSIVIRSVSQTAQLMVTEVRRQFKEIPGLLEGRTRPDYERCVDIATHGALGHLVAPCLLAISIPFVIVLVLGTEALAGLLAGCIVTGIFLALFMSNAGGAWDNAKKLIEAGQMGGKGSLAHKASVIGDTVGDPLKDTAGPALNILVQLVATVSLAFTPLFLRILG